MAPSCRERERERKTILSAVWTLAQFWLQAAGRPGKGYFFLSHCQRENGVGIRPRLESSISKFWKVTPPLCWVPAHKRVVLRLFDFWKIGPRGTEVSTPIFQKREQEKSIYPWVQRSLNQRASECLYCWILAETSASLGPATPSLPPQPIWQTQHQQLWRKPA